MRALLFVALSASVGLVVTVGSSSYLLNREIEARVDGLRAGPGADIARIDLQQHGVEIEGLWDERGFFLAREVDVLPGPRRPKLRGALESVDWEGNSLRLYGVEIVVQPETDFGTGPGAARRVGDLRPGQRVEISASVEKGRWLARKIKSQGVKSSDKVKGTPTRTDLQHEGGSFEIHGLQVVLAPTRKAAAGSALRRLRLATLMVLALQDLRSATRDLVGRGAGPEAVGVRHVEEAAAGLALGAQARLDEAGRAFAHYLDEIDPPSPDATPTSTPRESRLRLLRQRFDSLEGQLGEFSELAARDLAQAGGFLDSVVDPFVRESVLPEVSALRSDAEETLRDQVRGISGRARTMVRVALIVSAIAVMLALILGAIVWRSIDGPLRALHAAALRIGEGQLDTRVQLQIDGEFGVLARAFDQMTAALARSTVSLKSLEAIFDSMAGIVLTLDSGRRITNVNRGALEILHYEREELLSRPFDLICARASEEAARSALRHAKRGIPAVEEICLMRRDGSAFPASFSSAEIRATEGPLQGYICIAQDLSERKAIEEEIRTSLAEKELLLRELHHRVKNNMQVISSLLEIQASCSSDPRAVVELEESQRRIKSMALIHDQLHHASDLARLDVAAYLESLTSHLARSFGFHGSIGIDVDIRKSPLGIDDALVCGLIINELVTNSLKHAFDPSVLGHIVVRLRDEADGNRVLEVWDDGQGLKDRREADDRGLGLALVETLVKQLAGRIAIPPGTGTRIRIEFCSRRTTGEVAS